MPDVAIVGLGTVGRTLGCALKASLPSIRVAGFDPDKSTSSAALGTGAIDVLSPSVGEAVRDARLVMVATPLAVTEEVLSVLGTLVPPGTVVSDTCSIKIPVSRWAEKYLPPGVDFVGGHPILRASGDDPQGWSISDYCIVPTSVSSPASIDAIVGLASAVGAAPFFIDEMEHDSFAIATEYLPRVAAAVAVDAVSSLETWRDARRLAGSTLGAAAAAGDLDPAEFAIIAHYAPEALHAWLGRIEIELAKLRVATQSNPVEGMHFALTQWANERKARLSGVRVNEGPVFERQSMSSMFLGDWLSKRRPSV